MDRSNKFIANGEALLNESTATSGQNSRRDFMKQAAVILGAAGIMSMVPN